MGVSLRVYDEIGVFLLPQFVSVTTQAEFCEVGSINITYPRNGLNLDRALAGDDPTVSLVLDGVEQPERWLLEDDSEDDASDAGKGRAVTITGRGLPAVLERAVVYPEEMGPNGTLAGANPIARFTEATPGAILRTLVQRAQQRGALPGVDVSSFSSTHDSAGQPWPRGYTIDYEAGRDYLAVLRAMHEGGWVDWRMRGLAVDLYVADTFLAVDRPNKVVRLGREVTQGPRKRTRRGVRSHVLLVGDEGAVVERSHAGSAARYGRREAYDGRGGITALDTLSVLGDTVLEGMSDAREGFTLGYNLTAALGQTSTVRPGIDYALGDYIRYDQRRISDTEYDPLRVRTISRTYDAESAQAVEIEVADVFVEGQVRLARRVDALLNGSTSNSRAPQDPFQPDEIAPKAPDTVGIVTAAYMDEHTGRTIGVATVSWPQVLENENGTIYDDFGYYGVSFWLRNVDAWSAETQVRDTSTTIENLVPGQRMQARVRTVDATGNASGYTLSQIVTVQTDAVPPPVPSDPHVTPLLGGMRAYWDGLGASGEVMPADFAYVEVHVSLDPAFTPTPPSESGAAGVDPIGPAVDGAVGGGTLYDTLPSAGASPIVGVPAGETRWVRFLSVDQVGNRSTPTAAVSATSESALPPGFREDLEAVNADIDKALADAAAAIEEARSLDIRLGTADFSAFQGKSVLLAQLQDSTAPMAQTVVPDAMAEALQSGVITSAALGTGSITARTLATGAVTSAALEQFAVQSDHLADNVVTPGKVSFTVGGVNHLYNSSFDDIDNPLRGWVADNGVVLEPQPFALVHGERRLATVFSSALDQGDETPPPIVSAAIVRRISDPLALFDVLRRTVSGGRITRRLTDTAYVSDTQRTLVAGALRIGLSDNRLIRDSVGTLLTGGTVLVSLHDDLTLSDMPHPTTPGGTIRRLIVDVRTSYDLAAPSAQSGTSRTITRAPLERIITTDYPPDGVVTGGTQRQTLTSHLRLTDGLISVVSGGAVQRTFTDVQQRRDLADGAVSGGTLRRTLLDEQQHGDYALPTLLVFRLLAERQVHSDVLSITYGRTIRRGLREQRIIADAIGRAMSGGALHYTIRDGRRVTDPLLTSVYANPYHGTPYGTPNPQVNPTPVGDSATGGTGGKDGPSGTGGDGSGDDGGGPVTVTAILTDHSVRSDLVGYWQVIDGR